MRVPPQATDIERSLIATIMFEPEALNTAMESLMPGDFYDPYWRACYQSAIDLQLDSKPVDVLTLSEKMNGKGDRLYDLSDDINPNHAYMVEVIKSQSVKRQVIKACQESMDMAYGKDNAPDVLDFSQKKIFGISLEDNNTLSELHETMQAVAKRVTKIQKSGEPIGIKTGLDLDYILQGFQDSKLYILGARPSMGKTALVMTIMRRIARGDLKAGMLSLETSDESLGIRLITQVSGIPSEKITSGRMNDAEMGRFMNACQELSGYGIYIDDKAAITTEQLRSKAMTLVQKGCKILFVDFLQLVRHSGRNKHEEIGEVTKTLKAIAKDLGIPVVALSQLSRKVEERSDKRPMLSDLRESGSIEEDADCVMFLYRPEYYGIDSYPNGESTDGVAEIIIAKNKDGRTGVKKHLFVKDQMKFENLESKHEPGSPF